MPALIDLSGRKFGRWLVLGRSGGEIWRCRCDCGMERDVAGGHLRLGRSRSCGCLKLEMQASRLRSHGGKGTDLYQRWHGIRSRCLVPSASGYSRYGGAGITVCAEWDDFAAFRDWALANGYAKHLTIDREDNDKGYEPGNCRWATRRVQRLNQKRMQPDLRGRP